MAQSKPNKIFLCYDLGGTKLIAAAVDDLGNILEINKEATFMDQGPTGLIEQMTRMGQEILASHPQISKASIASAGPLDPVKGELLDPTNFKTNSKGWGVVPLTDELTKNLNIPTTLDNDAAAAVKAEQWLGKGKGYKNILVMTLGTGVGVGVICNGELLRAGRNLHPEASHIKLNITDKAALCGCGDYGCIEAYVSATNFVKRIATQWKSPKLTGPELADLAKNNDQNALDAFEEYAQYLAQAIASYVALFAPEVIILAGGFASASDLFLPATENNLERLLSRRRSGVDLRPQIEISSFNNEAGILGAARSLI